MMQFRVRHNYVDRYGYEWEVGLIRDIPLSDIDFVEGVSFEGGVTYTVVDQDGNKVGGAECHMKEGSAV